MPWNKTYHTLEEAIQTLVSVDAPLSERLDIAINLVSELRKDDFPLQCRELFGEFMYKIDLYRKGEINPAFQSELSLEVYKLLKKFMIEAWPSYL